MKKNLCKLSMVLMSVVVASVAINVQAQGRGKYTNIEGNNYLGEKEWSYGYTGYKQNFVVPVTGIYQFEVYGAKGADYGEFCGGYGGSVFGTVELVRGENLCINVGGQNGYNGGGNGAISNGGGATQIEINGEIVAMAGGGGGATNKTDGNVGGSTAGVNGEYLEGSDSEVSFSGGGGGGYYGGNSGYTEYHVHKGDNMHGGECYTTALYHVHEGDNSMEGGCYTIPAYHVHEGENTYYGGCYTSVNYHEHVGNETQGSGCYSVPQYHFHNGSEINGTGCYTTPVLHTHTDNCSKKSCSGTSFTEKTYTKSNGTVVTNYYCKKCGFGWSSPKSVCNNKVSACTLGGTVEYYTKSCNLTENDVSGYELGCGMLTTTPESYSLACGKTEENVDYYETSCDMDLNTIIGYQMSCSKIENETVENYKAAFGGSNYCNNDLCSDVRSNAGVNAGNGSVKLSLVAVDGATISYYTDNAVLLKSVTVAKGTAMEYPFSENPQKATDEKYSYTFAGWDNMSTSEIEKYSNEQTIQNTLSDFQFKAVYNTKGQIYNVILDSQNAENVGTTSISATYGMSLSKIEIPQKENYIFAGYYTQTDGMGKKYYDSVGNPVGNSDFTENTTLYAYWIQPLSIIKQPKDLMITTGYRGVVIDLDTIITVNGDYTVEYQWYKKNGEEKIAIEGANEKHFLFPEKYAIGNYYMLCEISVTDNTNQQNYIVWSNTMCVQIMKGKLENSKIKFESGNITYDGKYHLAGINIEIEGAYTIYYAREELTAENYSLIGKNIPFNFKDAGKYDVYYYIISEEYEDYAGSIEFVIHKAKPEILAWSKNVSYDGKTHVIDEVEIIGINNTNLKDSEVEYSYYLDAECSVKTNQENGASVEGGAPSEVGSYYVMVSAKATENYEATKLSTPVMLNILSTIVDFEIHGYFGIYDTHEHSITVDTKGNSSISIYYSTSTSLTVQNYAVEGKIDTPKFVNAGTYKIYYLVVNKLTGKLNSYIPGEITVTIQKAKQYVTKDNMPKLNTNNNTIVFPKGGDWEYKMVSNNATWTGYTAQSLSQGYYEFRLVETQNYYASEPVILEVKKSNSGGSASKPDNDTSSDKTEEKIPEIEKEEDKNITENEKEEENLEIKEPVTNEPEKEMNDNKPQKEETFGEKEQDQNDNEYEQDLNGNGIPDIFETDRNGNGIPDYYEWDMNGNGILDYLEDENGNGVPDFLEWNQMEEEVAEPTYIEIEETPVATGNISKQSIADRIKNTVNDIFAEENAKIVVPCVTVGMVIGLFGSYFAILLLSPFIKAKTIYKYYIETLLTGKTKGYKVNINTEVASIDDTRETEGIYRFGQLCTKEDYIITIQDKDNYSVGVVRLTFMKKRVFHEVIINRGIEIRVEQLKHGARIHIR